MAVTMAERRVVLLVVERAAQKVDLWVPSMAESMVCATVEMMVGMMVGMMVAKMAA